MGGSSSHLLDGGYSDDEEQREAAGDGAGRGVHDHLVEEARDMLGQTPHTKTDASLTDSKSTQVTPT